MCTLVFVNPKEVEHLFVFEGYRMKTVSIYITDAVFMFCLSNLINNKNKCKTLRRPFSFPVTVSLRT